MQTNVSGCSAGGVAGMQRADGRCRVCLKLEDGVGHHYGALSCMSCRAFFRRAQTAKRVRRCNRADQADCARNFADKKPCAKCRYDKCLR